MNEQELDEILTVHWPAVVRRVMADDADDWLKGFVRSIARHGKRKSWTPSAKQEALMRKLLAEQHQPRSPQLDLIECEGGYSNA